MQFRSIASPIPFLIAGLMAPTLTMAASPDEHKLELKLRAVHFDRAFETEANDQTQTALGSQLNYESPYFKDLFGFVFSGYSVLKLGSSGRVAADSLSVDRGGDYHDAIGKIGQAYVKLKYRDLAQLRVGRQLSDSLLLKSTGSRAIPDTYSGLSGRLEPLEGLSLYVAVYDEWARRESAHFEKFATDRSKEGAIDYVGILGAEYKSGPVAVNLELLNSKDYLSKLGLVGSYTIPLANKDKLKLSAGLHTSRDDGRLFVTAAEGGDLDDEDVPGARSGVTPSDNDGKGIYADLEWTTGKLSLGAALARFDGIWIEDNFTGDHGTNPFPTGGVLADLTNNDETVWMLRASYDWSDLVSGLRTTIKFKQGSGARNSHVSARGEADESELELDVRYKIPLLKGLEFRYNYLDYNSDKTGRVDGVKEDSRDHRIYLDYSYRFF